jgi:hypothetical protein
MVVKLADMSVSGAIVPANRNFMKAQTGGTSAAIPANCVCRLASSQRPPLGAAGNFVLIVILDWLNLFSSSCFTSSYSLLRLGERSSSSLRHQKKSALGRLSWVLPRSTLAAMVVDGNPAVDLESPPETTITRGARDSRV